MPELEAAVAIRSSSKGLEQGEGLGAEKTTYLSDALDLMARPAYWTLGERLP